MYSLNAFLSLLKHAKQILLVTFCDTTAGIGGNFQTQGNGITDGQEMEVEIAIHIHSFARILSVNRRIQIQDTILENNSYPYLTKVI